MLRNAGDVPQRLMLGTSQRLRNEQGVMVIVDHLQRRTGVGQRVPQDGGRRGGRALLKRQLPAVVGVDEDVQRRQQLQLKSPTSPNNLAEPSKVKMSKKCFLRQKSFLHDI